MTEINDKEYLQLGDELFHVLIPENYSLDLKLMVLAALKTYRLEKKSIDHMLKKYADAWAEQFDIQCGDCGRRVKVKTYFNPHKEDFITRCEGCDVYFCRQCLEWNTPKKTNDEYAWNDISVACRKCSVDRKRRELSKRRENNKNALKGPAEVIDLDSKRKI